MDTHTPNPEPVTYEKTDGQWYGHAGVDVKATLQRKGWPFKRRSEARILLPLLLTIQLTFEMLTNLSLTTEMSTILDSSTQDVDSVVPAGGNNREYLELAKKGGGHKG